MNEIQSTRSEILYFLRKKGTATAKDLTDELQITLSAVRQQLALLEVEELVIPTRETGKRGRPTHHYRLTEKADKHFTKNYVNLSLELINELIDSAGRQGLKSFLRKRKERFIKKHQEALERTKTFSSRIESVCKTQDESGYMASVKKEGKNYTLEEYNCPFIEVATKYPDFCEMERSAYEKILGTKVRLDGCRARGANVCRFCIDTSE